MTIKILEQYNLPLYNSQERQNSVFRMESFGKVQFEVFFFYYGEKVVKEMRQGVGRLSHR